MSDKINLKRVIPLSLIIIVTFAASAFFYKMEKMYIDEGLCIIFIDIIFLSLLIYELEHQRLIGDLSFNRNTSFARASIGYLLGVILSVGMIFLIPYSRPVIILPILIYAVSNEIIAATCSLYFCCCISFVTGGDYYELLSYIFLIIIGVIIAQGANSRKKRIYSYILIALANSIIPMIFYYFEAMEYNYYINLYGLACGLTGAFVLYICNKFVRPNTIMEKDNVLIDIISDEYSEVIELKAFSQKEYEHAKRVSEICFKCARNLGLDSNLSAAAGFYYRIGKWSSDNYIEEGVKKAYMLCFPEAMIEILMEYYGEIKKPSTPESALVYIVDAVIKKTSRIKSEVSQSQWNNDMMVYQLLNEISSSGMLDESGLGMNHFLKIRDILAKEVMS